MRWIFLILLSTTLAFGQHPGEFFTIDKTTYASGSIEGAEYIAQFVHDQDIRKKVAVAKKKYDLYVINPGIQVIIDSSDSGIIGFHYPGHNREYYYRP